MHFLVLNWDGWRYETGKELLMLLCLPAARKKSIRVSLDGLGPGGGGGGTNTAVYVFGFVSKVGFGNIPLKTVNMELFREQLPKRLST